MKLIDILARELKVWPEGALRLEQSFAGMIFYVDKDAQVVPLIRLDRSDDWRKSEVTRAEWQAAVDALKADKDMPPIGSHVVVVDDGTLMYGQGESGEVLAHVDGTAVIRMTYGLGCFLPRCLRTPDQIASEERQREISEIHFELVGMAMSEDDAPKGTNDDWYRVAELMHGKGYRKQVAND